MFRALEPTPGRAKPPPAKEGTEQTNKNKTAQSKTNRLFIFHLVLLSFLHRQVNDFFASGGENTKNPAEVLQN
jgi:hypothetical protein